MKNGLFKKSMSVFLAVLMLLSSWVFVPGEHHLHAEAASESATAAINKAALGEIDTNVNTTMTTTTNNKYKPVENGKNGDTSGCSATEFSNSYKNVLNFNNGAVVLRSLGSAVTFTDVPRADSIKVWYPDTVLMYDGITTPKMAVLLEADGNGSSLRVVSCWMSSGYDGLKLGFDEQTPYWHGHTDDDPAALYLLWRNGSWSNGKPKEYHLTTDGTKHSSYLFGCGGWSFSATHLMFTGSMNKGEWVRALNPEWKYRGGSNDDGVYGPVKATGKTIYVMNIKGYRDLLNEISSKKTELLNNAGIYTTASIRNYVNAVKAITNLTPNSYVSTTNNNVTSWGSQMTTAYSKYTAAVNGLTKRTYDVTYENMFSFSDWVNSNSSSAVSNGALSYDVQSGKITIKNERPGATDEVATHSSSQRTGTSSRDTNFYAIPVTGGKQYTLSAKRTGKTDIYLFWYNAEGKTVYQSQFGDHYLDETEKSETYTAPVDAKFVEFRFDNDAGGTTVTFEDIVFYDASRNDVAGVSDWTTRPVREVYTHGQELSDHLDVPVRPGYRFNRWYVDKNGNGCLDPDEELTVNDGSGEVLDQHKNYPIEQNWVLSSEWTPVIDVNYENLFSLADWSFSSGAVASNGDNVADISVDLDNHSVKITTGPSSTYTEGYTSQSSSEGYYRVYVEPGTEYTLEFDYDCSASSTIWPWFSNSSNANVGQSQSNVPAGSGHHKFTFTTPSDAACITFRFNIFAFNSASTFSNIQLYKKTRNDTVDFDSWLQEVRINEPSKGSDLYTPVRDGYTFDGWYYDEACINKVGADDVFTKSTTVYSKWTANTYTIKFVNAAGTTVATQSVQHGAIPTAPANTAAYNDAAGHHTFAWEPAIGVVTGDVTYTEKESVGKHTVVTDAAVAATCTAPGKTEGSHCSVCNVVLVAQTEIPAKGHTWGSWTETKTPTCTVNGEEKRTCSTCSVSETQVKTAPGHTPGAAATCTEPQKCTVCGEVIKSANGHAPGAEATCTAPQTCTVCGVEINPAKGHSYTYTSTNDGKHTVGCENCNHTETANCADTDDNCHCDKCNYVDASFHNPGAAATCITAQTCTVCSTVITAATGVHSYGAWSQYNNGEKHRRTCTLDENCTAYEEGSHEFTGAARPAEGRNGYHEYKCSLCEAYGAKINGEYKLNGVEACYSATVSYEIISGDIEKHTVICVCGNKKTAAHDTEVLKVIEEPTCTETGSQEEKCKLCNYTFTREIPAKGHTFTEIAAKPATCTADGNSAYKQCETCKLYFAPDADAYAEGGAQTNASYVIEKLGHSYGTATYNWTQNTETKAWSCIATRSCTRTDCDEKETAEATVTFEVTTNPTCEGKGETTYTATFPADKTWAAQQTNTEEIAALGHTPAAAVKENIAQATCDADGSYDEVVKCSVCSTELSREEKTITKRDHVYGDWVETKAPTYTAKGKQTRACKNTVETELYAACSHTETRDVDMLVDDTAPTGTIGYGTSSWDRFLENITFGIYVSNSVELTITADDAQSGVAKIEYYISDEALTEAAVKALADTAWTAYTEKVTIKKNEAEKLVAYAKITDKQDNVTYLSTDGAVFDNTDPVIASEIGCTSATITITEANIQSVTVNGAAVTLTDGKYTVEGKGEYKVVVTDKVGKTTEATVTVKGHNFAEHTYGWDKSEDGKWICAAKRVCKNNVTHIETAEAKITSAVTTPATCEDKGTTTYTATFDAAWAATQTKAVKDVAALGHKEVVKAAVPATCEATGLTEGKYCSVCSKVLVAQETVPAKGHKEVVKAAVLPTCEETGLTEGKYCSVCSKILVAQETIPAKGHKEVVKAAVLPTCEETGLTEGKYCSVCKKILVAQTVVPAKGHNYGEWIEEVPATCISTGTKGHYDCSACDKYFDADKAELADLTIAINPDAHTYTSVVTAPTCDLPGYTTHTCSGCGDTKVDTYVDALGHKYEVTDHKDASCTAEGYDVYTCENDTTHTYTEVLGKLAHTEEILPGKAATCKDDGLTEGKKCSVCGTVTVSQQTIPATGEHKEITIGDVPATCVSTGSKGKVVCEICGTTISEDEVIPKTDHQYGAAPVHVIPATCIKGKVSVYKCKFCDERKEVADPANQKAPHTIVEVCVVEATCEFSGVYSYYCTTCSETVKSETIPALGHTDKNGDELCDNCNGKYVDPDNNKVCGCICHKEGAFMKFIYKIVRFFWKLFKISKSCSCGAVHY